jgi:hypothetical protein
LVPEASWRVGFPAVDRPVRKWCSARRGTGRWLARRFFSRTGTVLMSDGGIDHHVFVVMIFR